jgi:nucleotide-binding universal stress UspA family protein
METIVSRLTGKNSTLLSFNEVADKLKIVNQAERGIQEIPVASIVGSVGRYTDFSRTFLPKQESDSERWARVASVPNFNQLPPIDVYQIGDVYFVLDGNHRVSIARQRGILFIPAEVTEVRTRAPLPPNVSPDELILQAEYVAFLENTNLDHLRPEADMRVSVPGQYRKLENHMEVHRFFIEMADDIELSDKEAVLRWYDEAYLPVVKAVREQGVLRGFPHRTETDLYLWISEHQAHLRNELGWKVRPEVATADLAKQAKKKAENTMARFGKKIGRTVLNLVMPREEKGPKQSWSQQKLAARYSDRLFADLLVVLSDSSVNQVAVDQALLIAEKEESRLYGLCAHSGQETDESRLELKRWFETECQSAGVEGQLAVQVGDPIEIICNKAALADLIIYGRPEETAAPERFEQLLSLIRESPRPVLISGGVVTPLNNILLAYDGGNKSKEALFAAAYMAERWGVRLTVVLAPEEAGAKDDPAVEHARSYLEMHEIKAEYHICGTDPVGLILETAGDINADLIVAGGYDEYRFGRLGSGSVVSRLIAEWPGALLICP